MATGMGIRVYELAKELGMPSKQLAEKAQELGIPVRNHMSTLTMGQADRLRVKLGGWKREQAQAEKEKPAEPTTAEAEKGAEGTPPTAEKPAPKRPRPGGPKTPVKAQGIAATASKTALLDGQALRERMRSRRRARQEARAEREAAGAAFPPPAETEKPLPAGEEAIGLGVAEAPPSAPVVEALLEAPPLADAGAGEAADRVVAAETSAPGGLPGKKFGVVMSAEEAQAKFGAPTAAKRPRRGKKPGKVAVEVPELNEFIPQVSYPQFRLTGAETEDEGEGEAGRGRRGRRGRRGGRRERARRLPQGRESEVKAAEVAVAPLPPVKREGPVEIEIPITVRSFSQALGVPASEIIKKLLLQNGKMLSINDVMDTDEAQFIALDLGQELTVKKPRDLEEDLEKEVAAREDSPEALVPRVPIVTVMGHINHGKTSLLDRIRGTNQAAKEAGGITQAISGFRVDLKGRQVCFIDTPGHEMFTEMRRRGAHVTDVVVLVVAADDGVMPQTREAYDHARAAGVKIVVAINKMDKENANPDRVRTQLAEIGLVPVAWGGEVEMITCSAMTGEGVDDLLETLALESELLNLKANPGKPAIGTVLEAHVDEGLGVVATVIVQDGTLHKGEVILSSHGFGRARHLRETYTGRELEEAGPATAVEVAGLSAVPQSGDRFYVVEDFDKARSVAEERGRRQRALGIAPKKARTWQELFGAAGKKEVGVVLKADVQGSLEPIRRALEELQTEEIRVNFVRADVGAITETDVQLADASNAVVIGFNVLADPRARRLASQADVEIRTYTIIYDLVDDVRAALEKRLGTRIREVETAQAEVRETFRITRVGTIAGLFVTSGAIRRHDLVRLYRQGALVWPPEGRDGRIISLKRFKEDVREVREGFECGLRLDGYEDLKAGDVMVFYRKEEIQRHLDK